MKRTKADLSQAVRVANKRFGLKLYLGHSSSGYQVTAETDRGGERDLSPVGTASEVAIWMEGFIDGYDEGSR